MTRSGTRDDSRRHHQILASGHGDHARVPRSPRLTGAIAPGSPTLAQAMTAGLDRHWADVVVEPGSGTGAITGTILRQLAPGTRLIAG